MPISLILYQYHIECETEDENLPALSKVRASLDDNLELKKKKQRTFSMKKKIYMGVMGCQMPALRPGGIFKQIPEP